MGSKNPVFKVDAFLRAHADDAPVINIKITWFSKSMLKDKFVGIIPYI